MNSKVLLSKIEKVGSLSQIIWAILAFLFLVYIVLSFPDAKPDHSKALNWGKIDLKSQLP